MPEENEYKWLVMLSDFDVPEITDPENFMIQIEQGTLIHDSVASVRIRKSKVFLNPYYTVTTKCLVNSKLLEIEEDVDKDSGELLLSRSYSRLRKTRIELSYRGPEKWCVDFYLDPKGNTYVIILEVEVPSGEPRPDLLDYMKRHKCIEIDQNDNRFGSRLLSNIARTKELINEFNSKTN